MPRTNEIRATIFFLSLLTPLVTSAQEIAFVTARDGNTEVYVMDADGDNPTNVSHGAMNDDQPAWSPDGTRIAFRSNRDGNAEIYVVDADGGNPTNLTNHPGADTNPTWSSDGAQIAFRSGRDGNDEIYVMDADGGNPTNLSNHEAVDVEAQWSPDGARIAFRSNREDEDTEIFVMDADGANPTNLTNHPNYDSRPRWSPDGARISFERWNPGKIIFAIDADGGNDSNLINLGTGSDSQWKPVFDPAPEDRIEALAQDVLSLVEEGELKAGQANGLIRPLQNALRSLEKEKEEAACNQVGDFIDEVIAKTPVPLKVMDSDSLLADAETIQSRLGCGL